MKHVSVVQHTQSEWLGLMEDHLEGRRIRFSYFRPFASGGGLPNPDVIGDGLILVGGGPWGAVSEPVLPTLAGEIALARTCLMLEKPLIGIGLGAQIVAIAADGKAYPGPLACHAGYANRTVEGALNDFLPARYPTVRYMRDRADPPDYAQVLAVDEAGCVDLFQIGSNAFGFAGHPGVKLAMLEDLVMEFRDTPDNVDDCLSEVRGMKKDIEDALVPIMTGIIQATNWMRSDSAS